MLYITVYNYCLLYCWKKRITNKGFFIILETQQEHDERFTAQQNMLTTVRTTAKAEQNFSLF